MGKQHDQLTLHEREQISVLKASGKSLRDIGSLLGKHASTICRELQRNRSSIFRRPVYFPAQAEIKAKKRKQTAAQRFRLKNQEIRDYVKEKERKVSKERKRCDYYFSSKDLTSRIRTTLIQNGSVSLIPYTRSRVSR